MIRNNPEHFCETKDLLSDGFQTHPTDVVPRFRLLTPKTYTNSGTLMQKSEPSSFKGNLEVYHNIYADKPTGRKDTK